MEFLLLRFDTSTYRILICSTFFFFSVAVTAFRQTLYKHANTFFVGLQG